MKILVSDKLSDRGIEILREAGLEVDVKTGLKPDELKSIIGQYAGLIIRSATTVTPDLLEAADNLKVIGRAGAGVDNVDMPSASKKGIVVMNTPGGNTVTTGEHAIAMLMSLTRNIPQACASMKQGIWDKKSFSGHEVNDKVLGIIGMGRVGSIVASRAQGLRMKVMAFDPFITPEHAASQGIELATLDEIYAKADYITIHTPMTKETRGMINKDAFAKMKKGVMIINCARGGIIDDAALLEALDSGKVYGAAIDVFEQEPPTDWTVVNHPRVIATPHLGASTEEAQENVALAVAEQFVDFFKKGEVRNAVNAPSVDAAMLVKLKPYIDLSEQMGCFMGQIIKTGVKKVTINYSGEAAELDTKPVTIAGIKGFLSSIVPDVNHINAPYILKERGVDVVESFSSKEGIYTNLIEVTIETTDGPRYLAGSVFNTGDLRFVKIDNYQIEVVPEGHMLVIYNQDKPGTVGKLGTILGEAETNIASLFLGRDKQNGTAIIIINIDNAVPTAAIDNIKKVPSIISVQEVAL